MTRKKYLIYVNAVFRACAFDFAQRGFNIIKNIVKRNIVAQITVVDCCGGIAFIRPDFNIITVAALIARNPRTAVNHQHKSHFTVAVFGDIKVELLPFVVAVCKILEIIAVKIFRNNLSFVFDSEKIAKK